MEEKKSAMPKTHALVGLLPQRLSVMKLLYQIEYGRWLFIKVTLTKNDVPEYGG